MALEPGPVKYGAGSGPMGSAEVSEKKDKSISDQNLSLQAKRDGITSRWCKMFMLGPTGAGASPTGSSGWGVGVPGVGAAPLRYWGRGSSRSWSLRVAWPGPSRSPRLR